MASERIQRRIERLLDEADEAVAKSEWILASCIADQAQGGEILVSSLLKELTESAGDLPYDEGGEVELKGVVGSHRVYGLRWE